MKKENRHKINYRKFVLVICKTIIITLITIIIGVNFLYTIAQPRQYLEDLYPDSEDYYINAQRINTVTCGSIITGIWPFVPLNNEGVFSTLRGYIPTPVPKYSDWFHGTFVKTYMINRKFIKTIVGHFRTEGEKCAQPNSIMFLVGCIEFVLLTVSLLPVLLIINNLVSVYVGWWAALCGGQIASLLFIAPYNSIYMWLSYLYNSTFRPLIDDTPKFITVGKKVKWMFVIIFLGVFTIYSNECVSKDISERIFILYAIIAGFAIAYEMKRWFASAIRKIEI